MGSVRALLATLGGAFTLLLLDVAGCGRTELWNSDAPRPRDASVDEANVDPPCGSFGVQTEPSELEVFIAMDVSGSMKETTAQGYEKLEAVRAALKQFVSDPASVGIGVTFAFFPHVRGNVPPLCTSDEACGQVDACKSLLTCFPTTLAPCAETSDCPPGETCEPLGVCGNTPQALCAPGYPCDWGEPCLPGGWCENRTVCDPEAYRPEAPTDRLPVGVNEISTLLDEKKAQGGTPTLPAIKGAIFSARARQEVAPKVKSIVLLATDGFPTLCDPALLTPYEESSAGIPKVAKEADSGRLGGVQTFVIGVFSPEEASMAQKNLDTIAMSGSGTPAYIITTDQAVTDEFLATLNQIRNSASACDYVLPRPDGIPLDAKRIKVRITRPNGVTWLDERQWLHACDPQTGGFVFDKDPLGPEPPARIQLCPASCKSMDDASARLEVVVDCVRENG